MASVHYILDPRHIYAVGLVSHTMVVTVLQHL